jgi:hypothetical protein
MGHSTFICPVANAEAFKNAVRDVIKHDTTTPVKLGEYTEAEFRSFDPERAEFMLRLKKMFGGGLLMCQERWTRGKPLRHNPVLVMFGGTLWIEVTNEGSAASTMDFLRTQCQSAWQKPEALPNLEEFIESPAVARCESLKELALEYARLNAPPLHSSASDDCTRLVAMDASAQTQAPRAKQCDFCRMSVPTRKCDGCQLAHGQSAKYCSTSCQQSDWSCHKYECLWWQTRHPSR